MENQSENITLRFHGNGVTPESFSVKELVKLLSSFEEGLQALIDTRFPQIEADDVQISLIGVENRSNSLVFKSTGEAAIEAPLIDWGKSVQGDNYTDLPVKTLKALTDVHSAAQQKGCDAELVYKGDTLWVVTPDTVFENPDENFVWSNTVLYGELIKVGGRPKARVWVDTFDGSRVAFYVPPEVAAQLSGKLYNTIALKGQAKLNILTKRVSAFKFLQALEYTPGKISTAFSELRNLTSGYWDKFGSNEEINTQLRND